MKKVLLFLILAVSMNTCWSQTENFNNYKYLIVDSKFDFVQQVDGYKTSSFTKFLFKKKGFDAYLDNEEFNDDLAQNSCKALYAEVKDNSGFLRTRSVIEITDCKGKLLFKSTEGTSKQKDYAKAYRESIRKAFESVIAIPYTYDPSLLEDASLVTTSQKINQGTEGKNLNKESNKEPIKVVQEVNVSATAVILPKKKLKVSTENTYETLYAQPNENGYQLVNTKPSIVFVLLKTNTPQKYIIKDKNGTLTKNGEVWIAEYYENGVLTTKRFQVKF